MIIALAMLIGALTSAAWVADKPYCYIISFVTWLLFVYLKEIK